MNNSQKARVALIGLGPIGIEVGKALAGRRDIDLLGAADPAPDKAGTPLSGLLDGAFPGVTIRPSAAALYAETAASRGKADVVAALHGLAPALRPAADRGSDRRRAFTSFRPARSFRTPELRHLPMARQIDRQAKEKGVAVLGTGVNPGLVMDRLVLAVAVGLREGRIGEGHARRRRGQAARSAAGQGRRRA